jgi:hypothetical protein
MPEGWAAAIAIHFLSPEFILDNDRCPGRLQLITLLLLSFRPFLLQVPLPSPATL